MQFPKEGNNKKMMEVTGTKHITKFRIYKNLIVVSIGSMIVACTDDALGTLQSTINSEKGIGVTSIAVQCAIICLTSLLLPKYLIYKIGSKAVMIIAMVAFVPFFAANYYPTWIVMISSSLSLGVGFSLFWSSICPYLNDLSGLYADEANSISPDGKYNQNNQDLKDNYELNSITEIKTKTNNDSEASNNNKLDDNGPISANINNLYKSNGKSETFIVNSTNEKNQVESKRKTTFGQMDSITARIFGFHSMIFQTSYIWSNLLSYYVLQRDSKTGDYAINSNCSCGAEYCNINMACSEANLNQPSELTRNVLISLCIALTLGAAVFIGIFLENFKPKKTNVTFSVDFLMATLKQTRKKKLLLLIPFTIYTGMMRGFYISDFTKSYIGCAWGIRHIPLVTIVSGTTMAFSSSVSGWLVKLIGRFKIVLIGGLLNVLLNVMLLLWKPDQNDPHMFFIASGLHGLLYGLFFTQLRAYYGVLFKEDEEAAFGAFHFWNPVGIFMSVAYSNHICNSIKVYLLIAFSTVGLIGFTMVEKSRKNPATRTNLVKR